MKTRSKTKIAASLTPMIDVTFLLIVFFVLVSQIVDLDQVDMDLPKPIGHEGTSPDEKPRIVLNIEPDGTGGCLSYRMGANAWPCTELGSQEVSTRVQQELNKNPNLQINLRGDKKTNYKFVQPLLDAITKAASRSGVPEVQVNFMITGNGF